MIADDWLWRVLKKMESMKQDIKQAISGSA